jgi:hypothetical protein
MTSAPPAREPLPDLIDIEEFFGDPEVVVGAGTNACVADSTAAYLVDLRTPPADARCAL